MSLIQILRHVRTVGAFETLARSRIVLLATYLGRLKWSGKTSRLFDKRNHDTALRNEWIL